MILVLGDHALCIADFCIENATGAGFSGHPRVGDASEASNLADDQDRNRRIDRATVFDTFAL